MGGRHDGDVAGDDEGVFDGDLPISGQHLELERLELQFESAWPEFCVFILESSAAFGTMVALTKDEGRDGGRKAFEKI